MVRSYCWILVLAREGLINNALAGQGFLNAPLTLASTRIATVTSFAHFLFMRLTLTIYADLIQLSPGDDESGANALQIFWYVIAPLTSLKGITGAFLTFVRCIGDYITP